jgi:hypothetical protein
MEIVPHLQFKDVSTLELGTFVHTAYGPAFVCRNTPEPESRILAIYMKAEHCFVHSVPSAGENALALSGKYILESAPESICREAQIDRSSTTELFIDADAMWLPVFIVQSQQPRQHRALNMKSWIVGASPTGYYPSAHKWRFGVRLAGDKPHWLLEIAPVPQSSVTPLRA